MSIFDEVARARAAPVPVEGVECPACGGGMVERTNGYTGGKFLGCLKYPRCTGTVDPDMPWANTLDEAIESWDRRRRESLEREQAAEQWRRRQQAPAAAQHAQTEPDFDRRQRLAREEADRRAEFGPRPKPDLKIVPKPSHTAHATHRLDTAVPGVPAVCLDCRKSGRDLEARCGEGRSRLGMIELD